MGLICPLFAANYASFLWKGKFGIDAALRRPAASEIPTAITFLSLLMVYVWSSQTCPTQHDTRILRWSEFL